MTEEKQKLYDEVLAAMSQAELNMKRCKESIAYLRSRLECNTQTE